MTDAKNFWNSCHTKELKESICGFYENGTYFTTYERTIEFLQLEQYIKPNITVLEVGVGLGITTKGLVDKGAVVSGLDVSEVALRKVKCYCEKTYTTDDLEELPSNYFDVIICNRVVQHVPTDLLIDELIHCIRSLKDTGVFAVQFVSSTKTHDSGANATIHNIKAGNCCRTVEYLGHLISNSGGTSELVWGVTVNTDHLITGNHIFHIRKVNNV